MSDEIQKKSGPSSEADEARIQAIGAKIIEGADQIEASIPEEAVLARDLLWTFLIHTDEYFETDPPEDEFRLAVLRAFFNLERRMLEAEAALRRHNLL